MLAEERQLAHVPLETRDGPTKSRKSYLCWIDFAYFEQLVPVFALFAISMVAYPYICYYFSESKLCTSRKTIPIHISDELTSLNVDLSFNHLFNFRQFLDIQVAFLSDGTASRDDFSYSISYEVRLLDRLFLVSSSTGRVAAKTRFRKGQTESDPLPFLYVPINSTFNVMDILAVVRSEADLTGMTVIWTSADSRTYTSLTIAFATLFAVAGATYTSFCFTFKYFLFPDTIFSMMIFAFSVAVLNPLLYVFNVDIQYATVFLAAFLIAVKSHFLFAMRALKHGDNAPTTDAFFCVFMLVYGFAGALTAIAVENRVLAQSGISPWEYARMGLHVVYCVIAFVCHEVAARRDDGAHVLKERALMVMILFVMVGEAFADIVLPLLDIAQDSIYGDVMKATAAYGYFTVFSLFFKRKISELGLNPFLPFSMLAPPMDEAQNDAGRLLDE
jgi:hypothetical protein